jgi:hypothetical protein
VQHADQLALDDQGHAEERPDPRLAQQRIHDLDRRLVQVPDHDRLARGRHPAREAPADRKAKVLLHLLLQSLGRPGGKRPAVVLDQENGRGVDLEDLGDPLEQLGEQVVEAEEGEGGLGYALDVLEPRDRLIGGDGLPLDRLLPDRSG